MITSHLPIFTTSLTSEEITPKAAAKFISLHERELGHLGKLDRYYYGFHGILDRKKSDDRQSNNKIVANYPKYIADFSSSYFMGTPVTYKAPEGVDIKAIADALKQADSATQDSDLALDASIFGRAYELIYADEDSKIKLARLSPLNAFVVYDDTVEQRPVFGVHYYPVYDESGIIKGYKGIIATDRYTQNIELGAGKNILGFDEPEDHYFGRVPIDEIYNNGQRFGDFEGVLTLIDAYNILQSDRVNDKEQFVNAVLVIKGQVLGDTDAESLETYNAIKEHGIMTLNGDGADAAYLTRQFDESSVEVLKNSIVNDIHKLSYVPDMSDEKFGGNSSGVAMRYKLLMLEAQTKIKERYFTEGLRYRLECIGNFLKISGQTIPELSGLEIQFTRSLPVDMQEAAQTVSQLRGEVSKETLLSLLPFVTDVQTEMKRIANEQSDAMARTLMAQEAMIRGDMNRNIRDSDV